jgi:hypothetical protein
MEQGSMALDITSIATEEQHTDPKDIEPVPEFYTGR